MTVATTRQIREYISHVDPFNHHPVAASTKIPEGVAVGEDSSGNARNLVAADTFLGFAEKEADNSSGSAGDIDVKVRRRGRVVLAVGSAVATDVGANIYASDNNTFTKTSTSNSLIGTASRFVEAGVLEVEIQGA